MSQNIKTLEQLEDEFRKLEEIENNLNATDLFEKFEYLLDKYAHLYYIKRKLNKKGSISPKLPF